MDNMFNNVPYVENLLEESDDIENFEIIDESSLGYSDNIGAVIEIHPSDARFSTEPYMKICKGRNTWYNTDKDDRTRISIDSICYIDHPKDAGNWRLKSSEKKNLVKFLNKQYKNTGHTNWEELLKRAHEESKGAISEDIENTPLLDYNKLDANTSPDDDFIIYADKDQERKRQEEIKNGNVLYAPGKQVWHKERKEMHDKLKKK